MKFSKEDRQFAIGVLAMLIAVVLIVTEYIDPTLGVGIIAGILAFYGYGEAQLKRTPPALDDRIDDRLDKREREQSRQMKRERARRKE